MSSAKGDTLDQIAALAAAQGITIEDIVAHFKGAQPSPVGEREGHGHLLKTLLGYVGGIFVFSGICLLISMVWDGLGSAERVIITLGPGLIAFVMGVLCLKDSRYTNATTPFFLAAAALQPTGMFVYMNEYLQPADDAYLPVLAVTGLMLVQQFSAFLKWRRACLAFFSILFWAFFIGTLMAKLEIDGDVAAVAMGLSLLCLGAAADGTPHRAISPFWYFVGTSWLLGGFFELVSGSAFELLSLGITAFMIWLSIRLASRTVLFVSVITLMGWLAWYTSKYFADVTGWPVALIVLGLMMIGVSAYAVKLGRQIRTSPA